MGGQLLFVRRLALGPIAADAQSSTVALALTEAVGRVGAEWRHGDAAGAAGSIAVWFRDPLDAHVALARRVLAGARPEAWYWPLAVPAWNRGLTRSEGVRAIAFSLGGLSRIPGDSPCVGEFTVERLGDGKFTCTGPMFKGFRMQLGSMALLRSKAAPGVRVVLASRKVQAGDQEMFRHLGVEPRRSRILGLKSSVHFRADFEALAGEVLIVAEPGANTVNPGLLPFRHLPPGLRREPRSS
jgi:hypothetical protein